MKEKDIIDAYCRIRKIDNTIPDDVLDFMKIVAIERIREIDKENAEIITDLQLPYIKETSVEVFDIQKYNPKYGDDRICVCGHEYYRHFDTYDNMSAVGCKYCECYEFIEDIK